jgi:hypothetical protein
MSIGQTDKNADHDHRHNAEHFIFAETNAIDTWQKEHCVSDDCNHAHNNPVADHHATVDARSATRRKLNAMANLLAQHAQNSNWNAHIPFAIEKSRLGKDILTSSRRRTDASRPLFRHSTRQAQLPPLVKAQQNPEQTMPTETL